VIGRVSRREVVLVCDLLQISLELVQLQIVFSVIGLIVGGKGRFRTGGLG
jgi:hypothetical protein